MRVKQADGRRQSATPAYRNLREEKAKKLQGRYKVSNMHYWDINVYRRREELSAS